MFASKSARNRCSDLRFVSCWPMFDSTRGPVGVVKRRCVRLDSLCACVARDRWHRAWPGIDDDEYTLLLLLLLVLLLLLLLIIIIMIIITRDRWHRAWPAIDGTVRGPPLKRRCARALRRSVRGAIAVSDRSNVALRGLCCDFGQNSSEPRCGRSLRPIVFSTLVSYRAGRCSL